MVVCNRLKQVCPKFPMVKKEAYRQDAALIVVERELRAGASQ